MKLWKIFENTHDAIVDAETFYKALGAKRNAEVRNELNDLVKAVYVHAPDKSSGHRVQDVEISYNYIGILPATLLYDLQNGKTA